MTDGWYWCWSNDESEGPWHGKYATREEAIAAGKIDHSDWLYEEDGTGFFIAEAKNSPLKLSDWVPLDNLIEFAEDDLHDSDRVYYDEGPAAVFKVSHDQKMELEKMLVAAIDRWQAYHGLVFTVRSIEDIRNIEFIEAKKDWASPGDNGLDNDGLDPGQDKGW
jgi:hypothetical protein